MVTKKHKKMHLEQEHAQYNGASSGVEMRHLFISLVEHSLCYSDFVYARKMQSIKEKASSPRYSTIYNRPPQLSRFRCLRNEGSVDAISNKPRCGLRRFNPRSSRVGFSQLFQRREKL